MREAESIVFIIDDDPLYRRSSERLVRSVGFDVQSFETARDFMSSRRPNVPSCLLVCFIGKTKARLNPERWRAFLSLECLLPLERLAPRRVLGCPGCVLPA